MAFPDLWKTDNLKEQVKDLRESLDEVKASIQECHSSSATAKRTCIAKDLPVRALSL